MEEPMSEIPGDNPDWEDELLKGRRKGKDFLNLSFLLSFNLALPRASTFSPWDGQHSRSIMTCTFLLSTARSSEFFTPPFLSLTGSNRPSFSLSPHSLLRDSRADRMIHFKAFHLNSCHKLNKNACL